MPGEEVQLPILPRSNLKVRRSETGIERMVLGNFAVFIATSRPAFWKVLLITGGAMVVQGLLKRVNRWIALHVLPSWDVFSNRPRIHLALAFLAKPVIRYRKISMMSMGEAIVSAVVGILLFPSVSHALFIPGHAALATPILISLALGYWFTEVVILLTPGPHLAKDWSIFLAHLKAMREFSRKKFGFMPIFFSIAVPLGLVAQQWSLVPLRASEAFQGIIYYVLPVILVTFVVQSAAMVFNDPHKKVNLMAGELPPEIQELVDFRLLPREIWKLLWAGAVYAPIVEEVRFRLIGFRGLEWIFNHALGTQVFSWVLPVIHVNIGLGLPAGMFLALLISSAAFGAVHRTNPIGASFAQFATGIVLGLAYYHSGTLLVPVLMHMMLNGKLLSLMAVGQLFRSSDLGKTGDKGEFVSQYSEGYGVHFVAPIYRGGKPTKKDVMLTLDLPKPAVRPEAPWRTWYFQVLPEDLTHQRKGNSELYVLDMESGRVRSMDDTLWAQRQRGELLLLGGLPNEDMLSDSRDFFEETSHDVETAVDRDLLTPNHFVGFIVPSKYSRSAIPGGGNPSRLSGINPFRLFRRSQTPAAPEKLERQAA